MEKRFLVLGDGTKHEITGEVGKFWICGDVRWRKRGHAVIVQDEKPDITIDDSAEKHKKKASGKKKKEETEEI